MANATARVAKAVRDFPDELIKRSLATLSSDTTFYVGAMIGETEGGYLAKFDDTQKLRFVGVVLENEGNPKILAGTAGAASLFLDVRQPRRFEVAIASVAITDIGRKVYATFDQTGTLDPTATVYGNEIGVVDDLVYSTDLGTPVSGIALVRPTYSRPKGDALQVAAASGAIAIRHDTTVIISKVGVAALTIVDPTTGVHDGLTMRFLSVTASAHTLTAPSGFNAAGTLGTWGGAKGDGCTIEAYLGKWYSVASRNVTFS